MNTKLNDKIDRFGTTIIIAIYNLKCLRFVVLTL